MTSTILTRNVQPIETPSFIHFLFNDRRASILWLVVRVWLGWQWVEDDFREMRELNDMGRTEDVSVGTNLFASIGFAKRRFGSDRDATLFELAATMGWEPGGPGGLLLLTTGASTRRRYPRYLRPRPPWPARARRHAPARRQHRRRHVYRARRGPPSARAGDHRGLRPDGALSPIDARLGEHPGLSRAGAGGPAHA